MTREILFRGKTAQSGKWVEGDLMHGVGSKNGRNYIHPIKANITDPECHHLDGYEVHHETVGQFTNLLDKNGKKIFEGDVIGRDGFFDRVICHNGIQFYSYSINNPQMQYSITKNSIDEYDYIKSNIHDNPELLQP